MSDTVPILQTVLSGLISGGGSAVTAFAAVFRDIKKRLNALEAKLGNDGTDQNPKTGDRSWAHRSPAMDMRRRNLSRACTGWSRKKPDAIRTM